MPQAEAIKAFLVSLGFEVDEKGAAKFTGAIKRATVVSAAIGAAVVAAGAAVTKFVNDIASGLDTLDNLVIRSRVSAQSILELGYAASLTGSEMETGAQAIDNLSRAIADASLGLGGTAQTFQFLGIRIRDAHGQLKTADVILDEVGNRIKRFPLLQQMNFLQRLGIDPQLARALTSDISGMREEFRQLYRTLGIDADQAAASAKQFRNSAKQLLTVFDALKKYVVVQLMGPLRSNFDQLRKIIISNLPKIVETLKPIIALIPKIGESFVVTLVRTGRAISGILAWFGRLNKATDGWAVYILAAAAAWKILNLSFIATPLGLILTLASVLAVLFDDFFAWREQGESLFDWGPLEATINGIIELIEGLVQIIISPFVSIINVIRGFLALITGNFAGAMKYFKAAWDATGDTLKGFVKIFMAVNDILKELFNFLFGDLTPAWEAMAKAINAVVGTIGRAISAVAEFLGLKSEAEKPFTGASLPPPADRAWSENLAEFGQAAAIPALPPVVIKPGLMPTIEQRMSQNTEIIIQGATDPEATARAVARQQDQVNYNLARNMTGVVR